MNVYSTILAGSDSIDIDDILKLMRKAKSDITEEGTIKDFC